MDDAKAKAAMAKAPDNGVLAKPETTRADCNRPQGQITQSEPADTAAQWPDLKPPFNGRAALRPGTI